MTPTQTFSVNSIKVNFLGFYKHGLGKDVFDILYVFGMSTIVK